MWLFWVGLFWVRSIFIYLHKNTNIDSCLDERADHSLMMPSIAADCLAEAGVDKLHRQRRTPERIFLRSSSKVAESSEAFILDAFIATLHSYMQCRMSAIPPEGTLQCMRGDPTNSLRGHLAQVSSIEKWRGFGSLAGPLMFALFVIDINVCEGRYGIMKCLIVIIKLRCNLTVM